MHIHKVDGYNDNLHKKSFFELYGYAKGMRKDSTKAEDLLWQRLRGKKVVGLKFRRQHPIDKFIPDFYCHEKKLVVELDGGIHDEKQQKDFDSVRTEMLNELGIKVIRFTNEDVLTRIENVIEKTIEAAS
jgi:very-short-patch-repair endonuclease